MYKDPGDVYIGEQIRKHRVLNRLTQDQLAEATKLTKQIISRIEKAERKVSYRELEKIAEALDQPIEEFTTIDRRFKLVERRRHVIDNPQFAIDYLDDWETFLKQIKNSDLAAAIKDDIKQQMEGIFHKVYKTFKYL